MAFPLLQQLMIGASRADLQHALLMVDSELRLSNQRKSEIISAIELQANRDDATHATLCRFLLGLISKTKIHALIKTIRPIRANTSKKKSIEIFIKLDAEARRACDDSGLQLVVYSPPALDQQVVPSVPDKFRRQFGKRLRRAAARKQTSKRIIQSIKHVLEASAPFRKIDDIVKDVQRKVDRPLTRGVARVFLFKQLRSALIKRTRKPHPRNPRARFTVCPGETLPPQVEMMRMWDNDHWVNKYCMLDTPAIRRHAIKRRAHADPQSDSTDAEGDA
jgi:hypothetical protein